MVQITFSRAVEKSRPASRFFHALTKPFMAYLWLERHAQITCNFLPPDSGAFTFFTLGQHERTHFRARWNLQYGNFFFCERVWVVNVLVIGCDPMKNLCVSFKAWRQQNR